MGTTFFVLSVQGWDSYMLAPLDAGAVEAKALRCGMFAALSPKVGPSRIARSAKAACKDA